MIASPSTESSMAGSSLATSSLDSMDVIRAKKNHHYSKGLPHNMDYVRNLIHSMGKKKESTFDCCPKMTERISPKGIWTHDSPLDLLVSHQSEWLFDDCFLNSKFPLWLFDHLCLDWLIRWMYRLENWMNTKLDKIQEASRGREGSWSSITMVIPFNLSTRRHA